MEKAIGIRLPEDILQKIERESKNELVDRSTIIRKFLIMGYREFIKQKAVEDYRKGKITLSEAARRAYLNIWEMEQYLIEQGIKSNYSLEDFDREVKALSK